MLQRLLVFLLVLASGAVWARTAAAADFTVSSSGQGAYVISGLNSPTGQNNPALTLTRGQTYTFDVKGSFHPFLIKTVPEIGSDNTYDNGVTNNGAGPGIVTFTVPHDAPTPLYYQCLFHEPMNGELRLVAAPSSSVAALPPAAVGLLGAALLLAGGFVMLRRWQSRAT